MTEEAQVTTKLRILGIDPAPGKGLIVFDPNPPDGAHHFRVAPERAHRWFQEQRDAGPLLIGWDAPIFADFSIGYTARPIEAFLKDKLGAAVSVLGFSGCPHWTISLDVLGRPVPEWFKFERDTRLPLLLPGAAVEEGGVMETHPAVALAVLVHGELEKYKGDTVGVVEARCREIHTSLAPSIAKRLDIEWTPLPPKKPSGTDWDDLLDAQVSYVCVEAAAQAQAILLGDKNGGFVVPKTERAEQLQREFEAWRKEQKSAGKSKARK